MTHGAIGAVQTTNALPPPSPLTRPKKNRRPVLPGGGLSFL